MEDYTALSITVSAIGTAVIAGLAVTNYLLARAIKAKDEQHQQEIKDLFQAIAISNLIDKSDNTGTNIDSFKERYMGKTSIF